MPDLERAPADAAVRPDACPLCGGPNGCGLVAGARTCWCFDARIPPAVIDRVPAASRDRACVCAACAAIAPAAGTPAS
jgi:hypothetical protein